MVRHGGSSAGSYLADPTSPIPSHCASVVATSTLRVNYYESKPEEWQSTLHDQCVVTTAVVLWDELKVRTGLLCLLESDFYL